VRIVASPRHRLLLLIEPIGWNGDRDLARLGIDERSKGENHAVAEPADDADHEEKSEEAGHVTTQVLRRHPAAWWGQLPGRNMLKIKWLGARSRGAPGPVAREYAHVRAGLARGGERALYRQPLCVRLAAMSEAALKNASASKAAAVVAKLGQRSIVLV